jgi:membrane-associated protease RseP (regulator of RpoE activity)
MGAVLAILLTHEMGHFVTTLVYRIPSSFPYCSPVPINAIGTMGAVIGMDGTRANRREMFDLGLSGPLAGLVVAVPILWKGIVDLDLNTPGYGLGFYNPLLMQWMIEYLRPDLGAVAVVYTSQLNPCFMAGWVGLLITGLNMLPISQLDGGHTIYALFLQRGRAIARLFLIAAILFIVIEEVYFWTVMLTLVILIGIDHPPTANDNVSIGPVRWVVGLASLAIPVLCFPPYGFVM